MDSFLSVEALSDRALLDRFGQAVRQDREHTRVLLELIDAIDRRKLWAKQGHSSLFAFCVDRFHMSESTAAKRIGAARTARRFPMLLEMVARGELHLSGIHRLKASLTEDNHREMLARAKHQTLKQIEALVRELSPQPDVPSALRKLPERPPSPATVPPTRAPLPMLATVRPEPKPPRRAPDPAPLSPGRYKLQVTLGEQAHHTMRQLQDLLAHQVPNGDPAVIVRRALEALLEQTLKKKAALTERPRKQMRHGSATSTKARSRGIPARLKREVWQRDQGRCGFVGNDGKRCGETRGLEFAHQWPWGKGGGHSAENLALRCRAHNALEADRDFGEAFMQSKRERGQSPSEANTKPFRVREPSATYYEQSIPVVAGAFARRGRRGWPCGLSPSGAITLKAVDAERSGRGRRCSTWRSSTRGQREETGGRVTLLSRKPFRSRKARRGVATWPTKWMGARRSEPIAAAATVHLAVGAFPVLTKV